MMARVGMIDPSRALTLERLGWLCLGLGLVAFYGPSYLAFADGLWLRPDQQHAPLISVASALLAWRHWPGLATRTRPSNRLGKLLFMAGLTVSTLGIVAATPFMILGGQVPLLAGLVLWIGGVPAWRQLKFPVLFLLFMIPLPGILTEAISLGLKSGVSIATEALLHALGYPAARQGVIIGISQYQVLVADACSGLQSMTALSALGTLYIHLRQPARGWHRLILILSLLPVALLSNLVRVLAIALLTYHAGSDAGQWLHTSTGVLVFALALMAFGGLDQLLGRCAPMEAKRT